MKILAAGGTGQIMIVGSVVWAKYFGRLQLDSITGVSLTLGVAGSALGPMPFGIARDLLGDNAAVLTGFALVSFVLALITLLFMRPRAFGRWARLKQDALVPSRTSDYPTSHTPAYVNRTARAQSGAGRGCET